MQYIAGLYPEASKSILFVDSQLLGKLMNTKEKCEHFNIIEFKTHKYILFPLNPNGDHWVLGVVYLLENTLVIYDPL